MNWDQVMGSGDVDISSLLGASKDLTINGARFIHPFFLVFFSLKSPSSGNIIGEPARFPFIGSLKKWRHPNLLSMVARNCMWCGKTPSEAMYEGTRLRSCKCDTARYCSSECQSNDWRTHKRVCLYYREKTRKKKASSGG